MPKEGQRAEQENEELRREIAEHKRAEALLHAQVQEFRSIVENAPDQIIRYDREFRRTYVNPSVAKVYGLTVEALIGKPIGSVIKDAGLEVKEEELTQIRKRIAAVFETGKSSEYEMTWPTPTGRKYYSVRLFPELDLNGSVSNVLGISRDITERKQAEDVLRRSEDHLRLVLDTTPALIHTGRPDGYLDYFNQRWLKHVGRSLEELQGWGWTASIHPDDVGGIVNEWRACLASGEPFQYEARVRQADGEYRWMLHLKVPLRDEHGNIVKWHGSSIDIEDRKQTEDALDERLRFETLVTELSAAFASLSPNEVDREIDKWLQTLVEFLGVDRASFFQFREDWTTLYLGHSYTVPGIEPLSLSPIGINEQFPWITDQLRRGNTIKWSRIPDDLPEQAAKEKKYAATTGAKSVLNIPVLVGGSVICTISFTSIGIYCDWPDATVARLRLVGEIFAAAVERKRADAERKRADEALRSGQERYRKLSENFPNGAVITYDTDLRVTFIAGRGLDEAGLSPDFFIGKLLGEIAPPEVVAIAEPHFRAAFGGQTETYECPYPDGRVYFCAVAPLLNGDGLITEIQVITQDITKPKQAEEALRASEEQFRQLAENIREVFWLATADLSKMLYISPAYEVVWGQSCASLYRESRSFFAAIHAEDRSGVVAIIEKQREQGFEVEYRVVRPDGSIRCIRNRGFPIKDESGRFYRVAGIAEDITERKHAEEQLRVTSEQLRALSARIQSAREEEGIRIAREIHDELGAALTSLRWGLEAIGEDLSAAGNQRPLQALRRKIETMVGLIKTTTNTVRRIASELRPVALDDVGLMEAVEWHTQQFQIRTGMEVHCDSILEHIDVSREQSTAAFRIFQEALTNILRHAEATTVYIAMKEEGGEYVFTISDDGRGITDEEKSGWRALGLLGMQERAHLVGAKIDITGYPGKGTVVTVRIPLIGSNNF